MFTINAKQAVKWPNLSLVKGANDFLTRDAIPVELWPKLARFRQLGILAFELELGKDGRPVGEADKLVLEQLTERQLYDLSKDELAELAEANKVEVVAADAAVGVKKADLVRELVAKLPKPPEPETPAVTVDPTGAGKAVARNRRGGGEPPPASPVSVG